eukprot:c20762_g1_i3.p1 GENE.c20762_g1_i3~~c20762_g1_i3.p1  ORF type:complete len:121 (-),score=9.67 c20762_g1_i3:66-428(-)
MTPVHTESVHDKRYVAPSTLLRHTVAITKSLHTVSAVSEQGVSNTFPSAMLSSKLIKLVKVWPRLKGRGKRPAKRTSDAHRTKEQTLSFVQSRGFGCFEGGRVSFWGACCSCMRPSSGKS